MLSLKVVYIARVVYDNCYGPDARLGCDHLKSSIRLRQSVTTLDRMETKMAVNIT